MNRGYLLPVGLIGVIVSVVVPPAWAVCGLMSQPVAHGFTTVLANCIDSSPVSFHAYLPSAPPTINSNGQDGVCEAAALPSGIGQSCDGASLRSGVMGDGLVAVQYDWGSFNTGAAGCPSNSGDVQGGNQIAILAMANDGAGAIITIGYNVPYGGYEVDLAFPLDPGTGLPGDGSCTTSTAPHVMSVSGGATPGTEASVCIHLPNAVVQSDCDINSGGPSVGTCLTPGNVPTTSPGRIYTRTAPCRSSPDLRLAGWTLVGPPDAGGNLCVNVTRPAATGDCAFIGATTLLAGAETPGIAGAVQVPSSATLSEIERLDIDKTGKLTWTDTAWGFTRNVYRGSLALLRSNGIYTQDPASEPLAARFCGLVGTQTVDAFAPPLAQAVFYLVTPVSGAYEGSLGQNSFGQERPNQNPCVIP